MKLKHFLLSALLVCASAGAEEGSNCQSLLLAKTRWKAATWNLNLLNFGFSTSSDYHKRSDGLYPMLLDYFQSDTAPDVLFLQEVWTQLDHNHTQRAAKDAGYFALASGDLVKHGMQILVRRSSIQDAEPARFLKFRNRTGFEKLYGVKRGVLVASLTLLDGRQVLIGNTHLTPFTEYANVRRAQIDQLSSFISRRRAPNSTVILGGDLNIAGDYSALTGKDRRRLESAHWLYSYFKAKLEMTDSHKEVQPQQPLFTFNNLFPPLNGVRRSAAEKRLDYIWHSNARTTQIGIEFSSPINGVFPSDHFLYYAILEI